MSHEVINASNGNGADQVEVDIKTLRLKKAIKIVTTHGLGDVFVASSLTSEAMRMGTPRPELVADVRARIAAGTYETPEVVEGALDKLAAELGEGTFE